MAGGTHSMYTFLLVDDEQLVRRGFRDKIDWEGHGFRLLEPCQNGEEAVSVIQSLHPDVVMTDICMPRMDGLAVAEHTAERFPDIVTVILSGFDDFQYAQRAIRSKCFDYVLKPVTPRELTSLLSRLKARLDDDRRSRETEDALKRSAESGLSLRRLRNAAAFASGGRIALHEDDFRACFGFSPRGLACSAVVAEGDRDGPRGELSGLLGSTARWALPFAAADDREAVLVFESDAEGCRRACAQAAARAAARPGATVGVGRVHGSWLDASRAYQEAVAALSYRLIARSGSVFHYAPAREDDPAALEELKGRRELLCRAVVSGQDVESALDGFIAHMRGRELSPQRVRHEVSSLFAAVLDAFGALGVSSVTVSRDLGIDYDGAVERLKTLEEARGLLDRLSAYAGTVVDLRALHVPEWKALDLKDYVARHYAEVLPVQKVAQDLSISASYLTKLAKRYLGASFVDYLTDYRMERARELLGTTSLMTYEVAEKVGYPDARYFSSLFRKRLGRTPSEYRNERRRDAPTA
jgi:two-component system, response regulator YesN